MKILITDGIGREGELYLLKNNCELFNLEDNYKKEEISVIIVRSRFRINEVSLKDYNNLKIVAKLGTGIDNIDLTYCEANGISVINAPGQNANATAEFAFAIMMTVIKNLHTIYESVKKQDFRRSLYFGKELTSLNVGIIGYGEIGSLLYTKIKNNVKDVFVNSRNTNIPSYKTLDYLLANSDVIILSLSLSGNIEFVNKEFLEQCKKNCLLINIARGNLVSELDMINHLHKNKGFIYCTDVLTDEPSYNLKSDEQDYKNELFNFPNFFFTPHIAGMTEESQKNISLYVSKKVMKRLIHE